jgi:glycosyltransferase involved in cell wall biosynthesis
MSDRALVCILGLRGIPGIMGGIESHCEELLPRIASKRPDIDLEVVARRPYVRSPCGVGRVRVTPLFSTRGKNTEAITSTLLGLLHAKRRGARAVHIHAIGPGLFAPLARIVGLKVIFTHHGADYDRQKWGGFAKWVLRLGERCGVGYAHQVIAVAPSLAEQLKARFPRCASKIHYIPNGTTEFPRANTGEGILDMLGVRPHEYLLTVGRLVPEKGFHLLIDALGRSGPTRKLVIVGGAQHETEYSRSLLDRAGPNIIFAGVQDRHALSVLYGNAALFILPSLHEGLPISALEAGSLGCPLLLSDIPGNRDLGLSEMHYFKAGDVDSLGRALSQPLDRYAVPSDVFAGFDWDRVSAKTTAIYDAVLSRPAARSAHVGA